MPEARHLRSDRLPGACHPSTEKGMTMPIVESAAVTGGVNTQADLHVAAALDDTGELLGVEEFPATPVGCQALLDWLAGFGPVRLVGIGTTDGWGGWLARHLHGAGVAVVVVERMEDQDH